MTKRGNSLVSLSYGSRHFANSIGFCRHTTSWRSLLSPIILSPLLRVDQDRFTSDQACPKANTFDRGHLETYKAPTCSFNTHRFSCIGLSLRCMNNSWDSVQELCPCNMSYIFFPGPFWRFFSFCLPGEWRSSRRSHNDWGNPRFGGARCAMSATGIAPGVLSWTCIRGHGMVCRILLFCQVEDDRFKFA